MKNRIFKKYFILTAVIIILFVILGSAFSMFLSEQLRTRRNNFPPLFMAKIIDQLDPKDKVHAVQLFEQAQDANMGTRIVLYNSHGEVVYNSNNLKVDGLSSEFLLKFNQPYEFFRKTENSELERRPPPPGFFFLPFLGGRPHFPPPNERNVIRLTGEPAYYIEPIMLPPPFKPEGNERYLPILGPISLIVSLLLGVGVTISLIYASVRKQVFEADHVISQIQAGNLKARFRVNRKDEFGEAMLRFNKMADEIEALVDHLKDVESSRNKILQELAHDLRTPVASLKNLLETIESQNEKLAPDLRKELAQLSLREVDYFGQLVEDLLLLAQVDEPKYKVENKTVFLNEVLDEVITDCLSRPENKNKNIKIVKNYGLESAEIYGSYNLLYRMFRNALENAISFARSEISIELKKNGVYDLQVIIADDGPGLSDDQLMSFGERKLSRQMASSEKGSRLSIGLGSVIIKKISKIHRGDVHIKNKILPGSAKIAGAVLTLDFHDVKMT